MSILQMRRLSQNYKIKNKKKVKGKQQGRMDRVLAWKPNDPGLLAASSASHSLCGWGQTLESCRESHHFAVSKRHVAARTALGLRAVLALGIAAALRVSTGFRKESLAKGNKANLPKPLSRWKEKAAGKGTYRGFRTRAEETTGLSWTALGSGAEGRGVSALSICTFSQGLVITYKVGAKGVICCALMVSQTLGQALTGLAQLASLESR